MRHRYRPLNRPNAGVPSRGDWRSASRVGLGLVSFSAAVPWAAEGVRCLVQPHFGG